MEEFFDDDNKELEGMRKGRKSMQDKDFARLINKKQMNHFEMDELFMWLFLEIDYLD